MRTMKGSLSLKARGHLMAAGCMLMGINVMTCWLLGLPSFCWAIGHLISNIMLFTPWAHTEWVKYWHNKRSDAILEQQRAWYAWKGGVGPKVDYPEEKPKWI